MFQLFDSNLAFFVRNFEQIQPLEKTNEIKNKTVMYITVTVDIKILLLSPLS